MSKRAKRLLSLLLTLVMVMSLGTPAFALGGGREIGIGGGFGRDIGDDEVRDFDPSEIDEDAEEPVDLFSALDEENGIQVTVESRNNALPTLAEVRLSPVDAESVREAVEAVAGADREILVAMDISFWLDGIEIEPDEPVNVKISAPELEDAYDLTVVHIPDDAEAEPETVELVGEDELSFGVGTNEVAFRANSFSTYVITGERSRTRVTVHFGFMENNQFVPFASRGITSSSSSFPSNGLTYTSYSQNNLGNYLIYDFPGYKYKETRYDSETGTQIWPYLLMVENSARYVPAYLPYSDTSIDSWYDFTSVSNSSHDVYVIYEKYTPTQGVASGSSGGEGQVEVPELPANKVVKDNHDGTYDITLSVTGVQVEQETTTKASVIVIFDTSLSMNGDMNGNDTNYNSRRRLRIAKNAVEALGDVLLADDKVDANGNKLVQMALISFDTTAHLEQGFTSDKNVFNGAVEGLSTNGATNWEDALMLANSLVVPNDAKTYVVFVSDGDPTLCLSRGNNTDAQEFDRTNVTGYLREGVFGYGGSGNSFYNYASLQAKSIVAKSKEFYTIGLSNDATTMQQLTSDAYSGNLPEDRRYFPATSEEDLTLAFDAIANSVVDGLGFSNVAVDDGVTKMTTVESSPLTGEPVNFVYRKGTNQNDPTQNAVWTDSEEMTVPKATISDDNHVIWDIESIGSLEAGTTYSVTFTVWPSQTSYDIIADINNGIIRDSSGNIVSTGSPTDAYNAQPDSVKAQIVMVNGVYTLRTNTGLNVSYEFNGVPDTKEITNYVNGSMPLDTTYFAIHKDWINELPQDSRTAQVLTEKEDGKAYLVDSHGDWILDENENKIEADWDNYDSWKDKAVFYVDLIITKGNEDYTEVRLTSEDLTAEEGNPAWTWKQMFIAPGVLTYDESLQEGAFDLREDGDDYTVRESPSDSYYWELFAEVYHPMVINGEVIVLQLVTDEAELASSGVKDNEQTFKGDYFNIKGSVYKKLGSASDALISAVNERRSFLDLTKVVTGENAPADAKFKFTVKMENENGKISSAADYNPALDDFWFSVYDPVNQVTVKDENMVQGAIREFVDGEETGYWHFANVSGGSEVTITIQANWNVRFINLLSGTTYEFQEVESEMEDGFVFNKVEAKAEQGAAQKDYETEISGSSISGVIEEPNTDYTVTYTNQYLGYFYVYHSSNNTIERFPMAQNGVAYSEDKTFNIVEKTIQADGNKNLYGGYFQDYSGKGTFDISQISAWPYTVTEGSPIPYLRSEEASTWTYSQAYNVNGMAMIPESKAVYYLKEVPMESYLLPYLHFTYRQDTGNISTAWLMSDLDDLNYRETGVVISSDEGEYYWSYANDSVKITARNSGVTEELTPDRIWKVKTGVISWCKVFDKASSLAYLGADDEVLQYWVTPDGITVTGDKSRTYTALTTISDTAKKTEVTGNYSFTDAAHELAN